MEVALAAIVDSANVSREGKLNLSGIYDFIAGPTFPLKHPVIVFAFRLRLREQDAGRDNEVRVALAKLDTDTLVWGASIQVPAAQIARRGLYFSTHIIELREVIFEEPGQYAFTINTGSDRRISTTRFNVNKLG